MLRANVIEAKVHDVAVRYEKARPGEESDNTVYSEGEVVPRDRIIAAAGFKVRRGNVGNRVLAFLWAAQRAACCFAFSSGVDQCPSFVPCVCELHRGGFACSGSLCWRSHYMRNQGIK